MSRPSLAPHLAARIAALIVITATPALAHVHLDAPNGGELLSQGTTATIQWTVVASHTTLNWDLEYSTTGESGPYSPIALNLPPGNTAPGAVHTFAWTVPDAASTQVFVRVRQDNAGTDYEDASDAPLTIVGSGRATPYGCGTNPSGSLTVQSGRPALGTTFILALDDSTGSLSAPAHPLVFTSLAPDPAFPCGTLLPGFGLGAAAGELLLSVTPPDLFTKVRNGSPWGGPGNPGLVSVPVPNLGSLLGTRVYVQGALFDPAAPAGARFGLTDALEVYLGT